MKEINWSVWELNESRIQGYEDHEINISKKLCSSRDRGTTLRIYSENCEQNAKNDLVERRIQSIEHVSFCLICLEPKPDYGLRVFVDSSLPPT